MMAAIRARAISAWSPTKWAWTVPPWSHLQGGQASAMLLVIGRRDPWHDI